MGLRNSSILCLALFLTFSSSIQGLDVTKLLSQYKEFAKFSQYLTETKLVDQINAQSAVTLMALDDAALSFLNGRSTDAVKAILGSHVIVGYYDEKKLMGAQGAHEKMTTLCPDTGVYVDLINEGEIAFSTSVPGAKFNSKLVRTVTSEGTTISLLQVSEPIADASAAANGSTPSTTTLAASSAAPVAAEADKAAAPSPVSGGFRSQAGLAGAVVALASLFVSL